MELNMKMLINLLLALLGVSSLAAANQVSPEVSGSSKLHEIKKVQSSAISGKGIDVAVEVIANHKAQRSQQDKWLTGGKKGDHQKEQLLVHNSHQQYQNGNWRHQRNPWPKKNHHRDDRRYQSKSHFPHHRDQRQHHGKPQYRHEQRYWHDRPWRGCRPGSLHPKCLWRYPSVDRLRYGFTIHFRD
jgi:hypothetical protein